ncbi:threonine aspartase 1 isoform X2 [Onthophagus taurus]|uniref:threonine aspartase 1 isoform X2 n=1 Tax=Onthophagus taurus TaxID=166361 RepID=UPI0039BEA9B7
MTTFIAVHCGHHNEKNHPKYNKLAKKACRAGIKILKDGGSALDAVKAAVTVLENDPLTNAGFGSNLTTNGCVEGDASIMDGSTLFYGGCGAVQQVKNPIELAHNLCLKQSETLPMGLIPPSLLVADGAQDHAKREGLKTCLNKELISPKALKQFYKYKKLIDEHENTLDQDGERMDTVGAVCIDNLGRVASGCSSGGLIMKRPGRVGQAALYASGVWADSFNRDEPSVAVCTTGCGEHLVQTQLAKEIGVNIKYCGCPTTELYKIMTEKFLKSRFLHNVKQKNGGALVLHLSKNGECSILWAHSTESMSVAYMKSTDNQPKSTISQLPDHVEVGSTVNVSGNHFFLQR